MSSGIGRARHGSIRPLTKHEIDRRIEGVVAQVTEMCEPCADGDACRPQWIAPGELVRRVRPFLGLN